MIESLKQENQKLQRHQYDDVNTAELHLEDPVLPSIVEARMDAFHVELKQCQAEILQQVELTTRQFDTDFVENRIEATIQQLTTQFEAGISKVRQECKKQIEVTNESVGKLEAKLDKVSESFQDFSKEIKKDFILVHDAHRANIEAIEESIAANGDSMKAFMIEALQHRNSLSSPLLPEKKQLRHESPKNESVFERSDPDAIPPSVEDAAMTETTGGMQEALYLPTL